MVELIQKKKAGAALSGEELNFIVSGFTAGEIPDYQMAAFLMAVCLKGMTHQETARLTELMADSGERADLSSLNGFKADKHSTGGVGDKVTLVAAPIAAACGVICAKMSGRGLGHTGGTADKLEAIPGFQTTLSREEFLTVAGKTGLALATQTGNLAPADKKIYALRDVTATVDSIPLIAASIMSKKLASGCDGVVLDVKAGSGAFMKTPDDAKALAREMLEIGALAGIKASALITDMDEPLGSAVGNALEVYEALEVLNGRGPRDVRTLSLAVAAEMLFLAGKGSRESCLETAKEALDSRKALEVFKKTVKAQGGDEKSLEDPGYFLRAAHTMEILSDKTGYIIRINAAGIGEAAVVLGAGRTRKDEALDLSAGFLLWKKTGDFVREGEPLARVYGGDPGRFAEGAARCREAFCLGGEKPPKRPVILGRLGQGEDFSKTEEETACLTF